MIMIQHLYATEPTKRMEIKEVRFDPYSREPITSVNCGTVVWVRKPIFSYLVSILGQLEI